VLLRLLFMIVLAAVLAAGAVRVASVARAGIELAEPRGAPLVGREGELVFRLSFADQDIHAAIDGRAVPVRRSGDTVRLSARRLRGGPHLALVRARTPGPLARTVERRVDFTVDARRPPLHVEIPRAVRTREVVVRGRTEPTVSVTVRAPGRARSVRPATDGRFATPLALPRKSIRLRITARDRAGNTAVALRRVLHDASAPRLRFRVPAVWRSPSRTLAVQIRDAAPVRLALLIDGRLTATSEMSASPERTLATGSLQVGRHRLELRSVDAAGNSRVVQRDITVLTTEYVQWRRSRALGTPNAGRLQAGVRLPASGLDFFTWNPVRDRRPNPPHRRWGADRLVGTILEVLREHRQANPDAPPVGVGDLSPRGGGPYARGGHLSHQNGLDVDVYYPRRDRRLRAPVRLEQVDRALAQDLVDRFVAAGAEYVFVDTRLGLRGPPGVVQHWPNHHDHLHARLRAD
jgi:hypothetical protein